MTTKNKKILLLVIIVLLIANSIFTSVLWFRQQCHHKPPYDERNMPNRRNLFFSDYVGFDSIQQKEFDTLFDQHHQKMSVLKEKERDAKLALFNLLKSDTASDATIQLFAQKASAITMQIDTLTYYHFKKIKAICKPEQMSKLADFFDHHFLHVQENNPGKMDSNFTNKEDRKNLHRMPPPNETPERFRPDGTPPPPPGDEMNGEGPPPPPPPGRKMGPPGAHHPPHDGPPPPDRRPPGPPENK